MTLAISSLEQAAALVYEHMAPTPQLHWPLLCQELGAEVWVKHENHAPTGAFKVRGGITFMDWLRRTHPEYRGIVSATRGNHGQSQARAARSAGLEARIVVPEGNSVEKNAAMAAFGADLVVCGRDFDEAREAAQRLAATDDLFMVPPFHPELVRGVATYALELFRAVHAIDTVYVPIGCGSGICGVIAARDALGLDTEIVGVVSTAAPAARDAFISGNIESSTTAITLADGIAVRQVVPEALTIYRRGASRVVTVSDDEIAEAMRLYFRTTHNVAEGAGAAALAALMQEREQQRDRRSAVILCGGNVDTQLFRQILAGETPRP